MAKKKQQEQVIGDEIEASSSEYASFEPEPKHEQTKKNQPKKTPSQDSSSSDSESESRSEGPPQEPNVNPQKSAPKANSCVGAKRTAEVEAEVGEAKESKRSKKKPENKIEKTTVGMKKQLFQRLWSEDDEIVVLNGMIDYERLKKKSDPAELYTFHEFIKNSLHVDVSNTQLNDKMRKLKKKYENNAVKEKKVFSKLHEQKTYELSKKIWGIEEVVIENNGSGEKRESKSGVKDNGVSDFFVSCGMNVYAMEKLLDENSMLIGVEKRNEMKRKLTSSKIAEMDLWAERSHLMYELVSLVKDGMKALEN